MRIRYFQDAGGYLAVTNETPKGPLRGLVFVGRGPAGGGIETIREQAYATDQLLKLVPVLDVPDEWVLALGYEQPAPKFVPPLPEPKPDPYDAWAASYAPRTVEVVIEMPGDKLREMVRARKGSPGYYRLRRKMPLSIVLFAISAAIAWWLVFAVWSG
jgi:hypothetical protein